MKQAALILLITSVLGEITFRTYARFHPSFIFYGNSYNRYRRPPHSFDYDFRVNSRGFKDVEFKLNKDENTFRILGIGDSFAYGMVPYQNNYLTLLEEDLNKSGRKVEVVNMGIGGTGPRDYLSLLLKEGLKLKPDMVTISFFVGNDFIVPSVDESRRGWYSYSYLATFLKYLIDVNTKYNEPEFSGPPGPFGVYDDNKPTFTDDAFLEIELGRSEIFRRHNRAFETLFAETAGYLKAIKEVCDQNKIRLAIVIIPDEVQVNKVVQSRVLSGKMANASADDFDFSLPNKMLEEKLQAEHIEFVDLLDEFVRLGGSTVLYKPRDTHWNIAGNRLAADTIARELFQTAPRR